MLRLQDIKFSDFQKFLVDGDLSIVGNEGERLYREYRDATLTPEDRMVITLENKMKYYSMIIEVTQLLIDALNEVWSDDLAAELCSLYPASSISFETKERDIEVIAKRAKNFLMQFETAQKERDAIVGKTQGKPTYEYYERITNEISKMLGFHIPDDINTMRWCKYYLDLINASNKDNGRG